VTFGGLVFRGTRVGTGALDSAFTGGALSSLTDKLAESAPSIKDKMKDIAGNFSDVDTGALTEQLGGVAEGLQGQLGGVTEQLSSIDTSGLSNALSNFGGFG